MKTQIYLLVQHSFLEPQGQKIVHQYKFLAEKEHNTETELSPEMMRHPMRLVRKLYTFCQLTKCKDETDRALSLSKFKYDAFSLTDRHNVISLYFIWEN